MGVSRGRRPRRSATTAMVIARAAQRTTRPRSQPGLGALHERRGELMDRPSGPSSERAELTGRDRRLAVVAAEGVADRRALGLPERLSGDRLRDRVDVHDHGCLLLAVLAVEELAAESGQVAAVAPD